MFIEVGGLFCVWKRGVESELFLVLGFGVKVKIERVLIDFFFFVVVIIGVRVRGVVYGNEF